MWGKIKRWLFFGLLIISILYGFIYHTFVMFLILGILIGLGVLLFKMKDKVKELIDNLK